MSLYQYAHSTLDFQLKLVPINIAYLPDINELNHEIVAVNVEHPEYRNILNCSNDRLANIIWILFNSNLMHPMKSTFLNSIENLNILPNSELFFLSYDQSRDLTSIYQFYKISSSDNLITEQFGLIDNNKFIDQRTTPVTSRRRQNLQQTQLKASMVITNNETLKHLNDYR